MKQVHSLVLAFLIAGWGIIPFAFADADTAGSSTIPNNLQGSGNTGSETYVNIHTGQEVRASKNVASTDAFQDTHPFTNPGGGDD